MTELLSVQEAKNKILANVKPLPGEFVLLVDALGRVLAQNQISLSDYPPFATSSMDGFAVRSADILTTTQMSPTQLNIIGEIPAGTIPTMIVEPGQAVRIMTGAPLPAGADCIVPIEDSLPVNNNRVAILKVHNRGGFVRPSGQDIQVGTTLLTVGRLLNAQDIGLLAQLGQPRVQVHRKPRVAFFTTGNELLAPGDPIRYGQIYDSNGPTLQALLQKYGAIPIPLGITRDSPEDIRNQLERAYESSADLILTSAGVSVGEYDYVRQVIQESGSVTFWRVNMRPGKPLLFGTYHGIPILGLPGNPVSSFITFLVFGEPFLATLSGLAASSRKTYSARLVKPVQSDGRETYLRGVLTFEGIMPTINPIENQNSGNLYGLTQANALLILPSGVKSLPSDSVVEVWEL